MLDNEGKRIIAKYYNNPSGLENNDKQKMFERSLFLKANKHNASKLNQFESDILNTELYVVLFRCYVDMNIFIIGEKKDNELVSGFNEHIAGVSFSS